jgi:hypothetical protein
MSCRSFRNVPLAALCFLSAHLIVHAQAANSEAEVRAETTANIRTQWFSRGRIVRGKPTADLRRRAYQMKLRMRAQRAAQLADGLNPASLGPWTPLGPMPLASDATGNGTQDYRQVAGRATAVVIDPADPTGNTIYVGGAQSGVWKSTNAAGAPAGVDWTPLTDDQPTLAIGALAIQPGNTDPTHSTILAATGEANNSADSYFGLGIERSTDAGNTWNLVTTANGGALSFSGLGGTRMAFNSTPGRFNTVVAAMAASAEGLIDGVGRTRRLPIPVARPTRLPQLQSSTTPVPASSSRPSATMASTPRLTASPGPASRLSPADRCSAPRPALRNRVPMMPHVPCIAPNSPSSAAAMRCTPGSFTTLPAAFSLMAASGRA